MISLYFQLEKRNKNATLNRIKRILQNSIDYANHVYANVDFYSFDGSQRVHRGIRFIMEDYLIDTDEDCRFQSRCGQKGLLNLVVIKNYNEKYDGYNMCENQNTSIFSGCQNGN